jgi:uncharacterized membrane protein YdfJ with MMPL/SSD domain
MAAVPEVEIRIMPPALGAGIILDATVLRALLVPALVALLGRWNWWLPTWPPASCGSNPPARPSRSTSERLSFRQRPADAGAPALD